MSEKPLDKVWEEAFANPGVAVPVGREVVCDACDKEWTDDKTAGGLLFESKAICPDCEPKWRREIAKHAEQRFIRGECPKDQSFADFVRRMRGPDAFIRVTVGKP